MKNKMLLILLAGAMLFTTACATVPRDRYNTQKGALIGAGAGALLGQAIGRNSGGTLLGAGIGTLVGAIIGNAEDQGYAAAREAARTDKRVVYVDDHGGAVEAIPGPSSRQGTDCRKVTKRTWNKGVLVSETVEEICEGERRSADY